MIDVTSYLFCFYFRGSYDIIRSPVPKPRRLEFKLHLSNYEALGKC